MKIVITGGNGYIGSRLSQYFADKGDEVIPVCYPSAPESENWKSKMYAILEGDIRQEQTINQIATLKPDIIIHLVSLDHFDSEKEPGLVNSVNVLPTWRLLDACTKAGLKKFIYFSTIQVYGKIHNSIIDETQQTNTANAYGLTHLLSEQICDHYNRKTETNVISIRLSNSYGDPIFPDNNCWWLAVNDLCRSAFISKEIRLLSDGTPQRDFIHGNDVCQAINKIIENGAKETKNNIYHISSGETLTLMEIAKQVQKVFKNKYGLDLPIITPNNTIVGDTTLKKISRYQISNEKIRKIGFTPSIGIEEGISDLFNYLEKNHDNLK